MVLADGALKAREIMELGAFPEFKVF